MKDIDEAFVASESDPSSLLWVNGSTKMRFDIAGNKFYDITTKDHAMIDAFHPLFFTHDVPYAFKYVQGHITKDYDVNTANYRHATFQHNYGLLVFIKLKPGVQLFDFTDVNDFNKVFKKDGELISLIFKDAEPYFAFNTAIVNAQKHLEPIEFSIAKKLAQYLAIEHKWKDTAKTVPITTFFTAKDNSFIQLFNNAANEAVFDKTINSDIYNEMLSFYKKTLAGAQQRLSKTGRLQIVKGKSQRCKVLPDSISKQQLDKVNGYFKLLKFCVQYKDLIKDCYPEEKLNVILNNSNPSERTGYIDLLQACLYTAIDQEGFSGFWCPEYIGKQTASISNSMPSIAVFDENAIEKYKPYAFSDVMTAIEYAKTHGNSKCNEVLLALRNGIASYEKHLDDEKQERQRAEEEKQRRLKNGEHFVDSSYASQVEKFAGENYDALKMCMKEVQQFKNSFVKKSPKSLVNDAIEYLQRQEIIELQKKLQDARRLRNTYNIERISSRLSELGAYGQQVQFHNYPFKGLRW